MKKIGFILSLLLPISVMSSPQAEIEHLLEFVRMTPCFYERNGVLHTGPKAFEHIQKKADYYADDIQAAEDFIEYSATKSMLSKQRYQVHCEGRPVVYSSDWLLSELQRYRTIN
ncbi:DUF5329 family protein [Thaumasiovibrio sp. DFM-14]|uniref:DUF5329 family protein n=1 Tax=Thaumasiovibrio sp. DFM-14 TaxID=3384792 RepID=UPI00399F9A6E